MKIKAVNIVLPAFTISGATGLIYEVIWQRKLSLIFGTTLPATTAVLVAFMGGLALGSWFFGKLSDRMTRPIRMYGILEIFVGVYCMLMPMIFDAMRQIHVSLYRSMGPSFQLDVIQFFLAVCSLTIPCALMGGTLPILSKGLISQERVLGSGLSKLYFLNTIGATFGTLSAGFILIRLLGMNRTNLITACINIAIGFTLAVLIQEHTRGRVKPEELPQRTRPEWQHYLPYIYAILGLAAMGTEVAWSRSLNLVLGSTVYAFSMMLGSYLLGLALGSLAVGKITDRLSNPLATVGVLGFLVSVSMIIAISLIDRLPVFLMMLYPKYHHHFFVWQGCLFLLSMVVVFPSTFFMGALFPAFGKAYITHMHQIGRDVGKLYLWNTLGGIFGSMSAGFLLIPLIGTHTTLIIFAVVFLLVGIGILIAAIPERKSRIQLGFLCIICLLGYSLLPGWNPFLLDSGVYVYAPQLVNGFESNRKILFNEEGLHSHVTVSEKNNVRSLKINGKTDGSDGDDLTTQVMLSILPLAHCKNPRKALIVGLGTGVTAGSALNYQGLNVVCIEIDDAVIHASRYFDHVSGSPMNNPQFSILQADARTVLSASDIHYNVIISEPSNPWITGVSNLFTIEYFESALARLEPDGVMCQWIHSYYMDTETLMTIFRSFNHVFPLSSLWRGSDGDYLILGSRYPIEPDRSKINSLFENPAIRSDLARIAIDSPDSFLGMFILGASDFNRMTRSTGIQLNSDDHPTVEFNAPMSLYHDTVTENKNSILRFAPGNAVTQ
ncbi:fused MFS/spermidine synthase [bacterium]|nr:fused MFS/spermidine synthase [candidate division CSSED10-310 bacterium]